MAGGGGTLTIRNKMVNKACLSQCRGRNCGVLAPLSFLRQLLDSLWAPSQRDSSNACFYHIEPLSLLKALRKSQSWRSAHGDRWLWRPGALSGIETRLLLRLSACDERDGDLHIHRGD